MSRTNLTTAKTLHASDEIAGVLAAIDEIGSLLRAESSAGEELGHLTDRAFAALQATGALHMSVPRSLGGLEATPRQQIEVIERISYHDASAGWAAMALQMATGVTSAYQGDEANSELFGADRYPLMAGQGNRMGKVNKVDGGYRISGSWSFASGLPHATHIHTGGLVEETGERMIFTFAKELATVEDNWDVLGLRATGSNDYFCENVFVPEAYAFAIGKQESEAGGNLYLLGLQNLASINHGGWALGVGRRLLDEMRATAVKKTGTPGATVDSAEFYAEFARAEAAVRSARSFLMDVWADNEESLAAGEKLSVDQETSSRLALYNATWSAHDACMMVYKWAGTSALREGDIQRFFRDMHAGTQHITSGPAVLQSAGRMLSGLAPDYAWSFGSLIPPKN
jgi:alkylation response protein AidB-like acyl-CoA dehydrogenase